MKLFIQARKDGYNILFPSPTPPEFFQFASDIQRIDAQNDVRYYGKGVYSIAFTNGGCIFSKFIIVYDVQRSYLGNVGISVFIANVQKLSGLDVKSLLDELGNTYCTNYCPDYYLQNKQEDWLLFTTLVDSYRARLRNVPIDYAENMNSGSSDAAFLYYSDDVSLKKEKIFTLKEYLDEPYQEEYSDYKQVFLIDKRMEFSSENPLNALRHSENNLTGRIDLENVKYKLSFNSQEVGGLKIRVTANGKELFNGNKVRRKNVLYINYSQKFRESLPVEGTWEHIKELYPSYIDIDTVNDLITLHPIPLDLKQKPVKIFITDTSNNPIISSKIECKNIYNGNIKNIFDNQIVFQGDEIGEQWNIKAIADGFRNEEFKFQPEFVGETIHFRLSRLKIIEIQVIDSKNDLPVEVQYKLRIIDYKRESPRIPIQQNKHTIFFIDEEIEKDWYIEIDAYGYEFQRIGPIYPSSQKESEIIQITLERKSQIFGNNLTSLTSPNTDITISFKAGKNGKLIDYDTDRSKTIRFTDHNSVVYEHAPQCKANFFYKYAGWYPDEYSNRIYYTAKFKPHILRIFLTIISFTFLFCLCFYIILPKHDKENNQTEITDQIIIKYSEGTELLPEVLNEYKSLYPYPTTNIASDRVWWNPLTWLDNKEMVKNITEDENHEQILFLIDNGIRIRKLIKEGDYTELLKQSFSQQQSKFKETIDKIDKDQYNYYQNNLGYDLDKITLNQIVERIDSINNVLNTLENQQINDSKSNLQDQVNRNLGNTSTEENSSSLSSADSITKSETDSANRSSSIIESNNTSYPEKNISTDISKELQGDKLTSLKLSEFEEGDNSKYSNSLKLYRDFFDLIKNTDYQKNSFDILLKKVKSDNILKNSELKFFLESICKDSITFEENFKNKMGRISKDDRQGLSVEELKNQLNKFNI